MEGLSRDSCVKELLHCLFCIDTLRNTIFFPWKIQRNVQFRKVCCVPPTVSWLLLAPVTVDYSVLNTFVI